MGGRGWTRQTKRVKWVGQGVGWDRKQHLHVQALRREEWDEVAGAGGVQANCSKGRHIYVRPGLGQARPAPMHRMAVPAPSPAPTFSPR